MPAQGSECLAPGTPLTFIDNGVKPGRRKLVPIDEEERSIRDPQDPDARLCKNTVAQRVSSRVVVLSVELDAEASFRAVEVDAIGPDGILSSESESGPRTTKELPNDHLDDRGGLAGCPCLVARRITLVPGAASCAHRDIVLPADSRLSDGERDVPAWSTTTV